MDHFYGIYGVGAVILIVFSEYFNKNKYILFLGGYIIGSITEYLMSFFIEISLHTKWWDYSNNILNINGRVCLLYSIFWGVLAVILVNYFNPVVDKLIYNIANKIPNKASKIIISFIIILLILDCFVTCYAQDIFITRIVISNNIQVKDRDRREEDFKKLQEREPLNKFVNTYWNDKKMIQTFPNIKIEDINSNVIYIDSLLPEIRPYYKKLF